jgi:uncharacterized membrane protein YagU involved in acid resistance
MSVAELLLWGAVAAAVQATLMGGAQELGLSRMSFPFILGTVFTPNRDLASAVGFVAHLALGWLLALVYDLIFQRLGWADLWLGAGLGLGHAFFVLFALMPIIPGLHPRMASEKAGPDPTHALEPPGLMALNYGRWTSAVTVIAHVAYGAVLGAAWHP